MKRMKTGIGILIVVLMLFLLYLVIGILAGYHRQPMISQETIQRVEQEGIWKEQKQPERAVIIEKNGQALLERVRMIEQAESEILLSTFAFHSDDSGRIVLGALLEAADRGVQIRIIVDGFECLTAMEGNSYFYVLSSHENARIRVYNQVDVLRPWRMMGRMHDKYLIIDEKLYMLGGRNTYNFFLGDFPGHKNFDRDALVYCEQPDKNSSVTQLMAYAEKVWESPDCTDFHEDQKLAEKKKIQNAGQELRTEYDSYRQEHQKEIEDTDYTDETAEVRRIALLSNPIGVGPKEPVVWYELCSLMLQAKDRVVLHTPYIICNDRMYQNLMEIVSKTKNVILMTNSVGNNGNPFGAADLHKYKDRILDTGVKLWEYEGGYSYHGKSVLIDEDISVIGSFNLDMRSVYLDTELMLVIDSREINQEMEQAMTEYQQCARQAMPDGSYENPYGATPVEATTKKKVRIWMLERVLGAIRFLF